MQNDYFALTALSPLDGRYQPQLQITASIFSEFALIQQRIKVEVAYLLFLVDKKLTPELTPSQRNEVKKIATNFDFAEAKVVKEIEQKIKHDVKAVEYYLREKINELGLPLEQFVHLGLTSEDTNSLAQALILKEAKEKIILPSLTQVLKQLASMATQYQTIPMLARTHGQLAIPTTLGKELLVFGLRLHQELLFLKDYSFAAKLSGAVGNFSAHQIIWEEIDWLKAAQEFTASLGLESNLFTTQIVPAETYTRFFSSLVRVNGILLDLNQDLWRYISDGYFIQTPEKNQVGSSTMPQKINPIDFENSEGNLGIATSLLVFFIQKLPISRLQRDLSDSTVKRNFGTAIGHSYLAYHSLIRGLQKITVNETKLHQELEEHWEIITEAFQVILRAEGDTQGYEKLKDLAQGKLLTQEILKEFIDSLSINKTVKEKLKTITPFSYVGLTSEITQLGLVTINIYLEGEL